MTPETKAHPFELSGMGLAPFRFLFSWSFPSPSLAEQNPSAYQNAMASMPKDLSNGCGTCANCGMSISNIFVVANSAGVKYGVGCDCAEKTGDKGLGDAVRVAAAKLQKEQRRARLEAQREARHQIWLSAICNDRNETNAQRLERESQERIVAEQARVTEANSTTGRFLLALCGTHEAAEAFQRDAGAGVFGQWFQTVARDMARGGGVPRGRGIEIFRETAAKQAGRRNSSAYINAYDAATKRLVEFGFVEF